MYVLILGQPTKNRITFMLCLYLQGNQFMLEITIKLRHITEPAKTIAKSMVQSKTMAMYKIHFPIRKVSIDLKKFKNRRHI